ncbi:hypothetical protein DFH06DRAFT_1143748 [Mycena polygramma]|nr:hypothetical protein DFH06DRAFT_1143748 [Mycena polygramma]
MAPVNISTSLLSVACFLALAGSAVATVGQGRSPSPRFDCAHIPVRGTASLFVNNGAVQQCGEVIQDSALSMTIASAVWDGGAHCRKKATVTCTVHILLSSMANQLDVQSKADPRCSRLRANFDGDVTYEESTNKFTPQISQTSSIGVLGDDLFNGISGRGTWVFGQCSTARAFNRANVQSPKHHAER